MGRMKEYMMELEEKELETKYNLHCKNLLDFCTNALNAGASTDEDVFLYVSDRMKNITLTEVHNVLNLLAKNKGFDDR